MTDDLTLLTDAAREAGKIASRFFQGSVDQWDKPGDQGPVTEADLAVDAMLREDLMAARPSYGWLSEETEDTKDRLSQDVVFIVDPIDGTRAFIQGSTTWAHSLAVVRDGQVEAAVVYLPMRDMLYTAARGQGAMLNGQTLSASNRQTLDDAIVLAAKPNLDPSHWAGGNVPPVNRQFRSSLAYRLSSVGEGRFDAMLTLRPTWEWDVAAGSLIVEEAGGRVSDLSGRSPFYNNPVPQLSGMVAGGGYIHDALISRLR